MPEYAWFSAVAQALPRLKGSTRALMLFGSHAREDHSEHSDVDLLQIVSNRRTSYKVGRVNVAVYDTSTLTAMAQAGSLFVLHLIKEGRTLDDKDGVLRSCLSQYRKPSSYAHIYSEMRCLSALLDASEDYYLSAWKQFGDLAVYILRTWLYAECAEAGSPAFSIYKISTTRNERQLYELSQLKDMNQPDFEKFLALRAKIEEGLKFSAVNPFGSTEALIVNSYSHCPAIVPFGLRIIARENIESTYGVLPV